MTYTDSETQTLTHTDTDTDTDSAVAVQLYLLAVPEHRNALFTRHKTRRHRRTVSTLCTVTTGLHATHLATCSVATSSTTPQYRHTSVPSWDDLQIPITEYMGLCFRSHSRRAPSTSTTLCSVPREEKYIKVQGSCVQSVQ